MNSMSRTIIMRLFKKMKRKLRRSKSFTKSAAAIQFPDIYGRLTIANDGIPCVRPRVRISPIPDRNLNGRSRFEHGVTREGPSAQLSITEVSTSTGHEKAVVETTTPQFVSVSRTKRRSGPSWRELRTVNDELTTSAEPNKSNGQLQ